LQGRDAGDGIDAACSKVTPPRLDGQGSLRSARILGERPSGHAEYLIPGLSCVTLRLTASTSPATSTPRRENFGREARQ
jgi:hypothetical protein